MLINEEKKQQRKKLYNRATAVYKEKSYTKHKHHTQKYLFRVLGALPRLPVLVAPRLVHRVEVALVQEHQEHRVVPEARQAVHRWHRHHECEQVVDERVDGLVRHHPPRHVRHALQLFLCWWVLVWGLCCWLMTPSRKRASDAQDGRREGGRRAREGVSSCGSVKTTGLLSDLGPITVCTNNTRGEKKNGIARPKREKKRKTEKKITRSGKTRRPKYIARAASQTLTSKHIAGVLSPRSRRWGRFFFFKPF